MLYSPSLINCRKLLGYMTKTHSSYYDIIMSQRQIYYHFIIGLQAFIIWPWLLLPKVCCNQSIYRTKIMCFGACELCIENVSIVFFLTKSTWISEMKHVQFLISTHSDKVSPKLYDLTRKSCTLKIAEETGVIPSTSWPLLW